MTAAGWNLLIYAIASDATQHHDLLEAIADMRAALTSERCNIAVQVMAKARTTRYWISSGIRTQAASLAEVADASQPGSLTSFLDAAGEALPAGPTALVLWAHASGLDGVHAYPAKQGGGLGGPGHGARDGWIAPARTRATALAQVAQAAQVAVLGARGHIEEPTRHERHGCRWGPDPNTGRYLTNVAMRLAIAASVRGRVELLGLNACWMATLEIEHELRHVSAVEVASQVYARPWPYRAIVAALSRAPVSSAAQLAETIVSSVHLEIERGRREDAVSAFRAGAAMEDLAAAFDHYAGRVTALIAKDWDAVRDAVMREAQRIDDPHQVDLASLVSVLGRHDREARALGAVVAAKLAALRIGNAAHTQHPGVHGLSIFCPKSTEVDLTDAYRGTEFQTHRWASFLVRFQRRLARS